MDAVHHLDKLTIQDLVDFFLVHLRAHVLKSAAHGNGNLFLIFLHLLSDPKVDDSKTVVVVRLDEDNVEGFDIKMKDPLRVDELNASDNLPNENLALPLCETIVIRSSPGDEVATSEVLGHKDRVERPLEEPDQLDDEGGLDQGTEHGHLCAHLALLLLLKLGRCQVTCDCVLHKENVSKGSRTNLPLHLVPLLELIKLSRLCKTF